MKKHEIVVAPTVHAMLTGAIWAKIYGKGSPRVVELTYTDGTTESAYLTAEEIAAGKENWFSMVSAVQLVRRDDHIGAERRVGGK